MSKEKRFQWIPYPQVIPPKKPVFRPEEWCHPIHHDLDGHFKAQNLTLLLGVGKIWTSATWDE